ncbi:MAG: 50S ribosomal protein L14 [Methanomicrobia archaeon]|nr:50S ribosomal protein L14 [Methanomicrobia archaeon]
MVKKGAGATRGRSPIRPIRSLTTGSSLVCADNTGAKELQCFRILGGTRHRTAQLGDVIVGTIKKAEPRRIIKKHEVVRAVIIRQKKNYRRADGSYIHFDDNACVILEGKTKEPKGGRIFGPLPKEIKEKGFDKIAGLAEELV